MVRLRVASLSILTTAFLLGCAAPPPSEWLALQEKVQPIGKVPFREKFEAAPLKENPTLTDYISYALENNPEVIAGRKRVEALRQRIPQVTALEDPMLEVMPIGQMPQTAAGDMMVGVSGSQKFPFPGKLAASGKMARFEAEESRENLRGIEVRLVANVKNAYYALYTVAKSLRVNERNQELMQQFIKITEAKYTVGKAEQQDLLKAQVELSNLINERLSLAQESESAKARLNALLNRQTSAPIPEPADFPLEIAKLQSLQGRDKLESLQDQAVATRPELKVMEEGIKRSEAAVTLAKLQYFPDLTIGLTWNSIANMGVSPGATGKDDLFITFGANIPLWQQKYRAGVLEAEAELYRAKAQYYQMRNDVFFEIKDSLAKVQASERIVKLIEDTILPQTRQTLDASRAGYEAGRVDFLTLIDNWRTLLNLELDLYRQKAALEQNFADLERAVGQRLEKESAQRVETRELGVESEGEEKGVK